MLQVLTDEEAIAATDEQIERVAKAIAYTLIAHPGTSVDALSKVLFMVNGPHWIGSSDMARARVMAKSLATPAAPAPAAGAGA